MKKIYLFSVLFISPFLVGAQISAPTASFVESTMYTNGSPNDSIYIFCDPAMGGSLTGNAPSGPGPFTFSWSVFDPVTYTYGAYSLSTGSSSTITGLASGGYLLNATDALGNLVFCGRAWVFFDNVTTVDAGTLSPACGGNITLNGVVDTVSDFIYYNPSVQNFLVGPSTQISLCLDATHTQVSDLGFYLVGPVSCGSPVVTLSPQSVGAPLCNTGNDVSNLCFSSSSVSVFDICTASTPLTGTYGAYGSSSTVTAIDWSPLYGCDAAGSWSVQVFDCNHDETGTLTGVHLEFYDPVICNAFAHHGAAPIAEPIIDMACSGNSATLYALSAIPEIRLPVVLNNNITAFLWTSADGIPVPGATTSLNPVLPTPDHDNWYYLTTTDNFGCNRVDSVFFQNNCPCSLSVTANPSVCDPVTNKYTLNGQLSFVSAPSTGMLVVGSSCGGTYVFTPPFVSPLNYSFPGLSSNGLPCTVTAHFTDSSTCAATVNYTAPDVCYTDCIILSMTADVVSCNPVTNEYSVTGEIYFANEPVTGMLTVKLNNTVGPLITLNFPVPVSSPLTYTFTNVPTSPYTVLPPAQGTVTATFTAEPACGFAVLYDVPKQPLVTGLGSVCEDGGPVFNFTYPPGGAWTGEAAFAFDSTDYLHPDMLGEGVFNVTYISPGSCPLSTFGSIYVNPTTHMTLTSLDSVICFGEVAYIGIDGGGGSVHSEPLYIGYEYGDIYSTSPLNTTLYTVTSNAPCSDTLKFLIEVKQPPTITADLEPMYCPGDTAVIVLSGAHDYSISPPTGLIDPVPDTLVAVLDQTIYYTLFGYSSDGCPGTYMFPVIMANSIVAVTPVPSSGVAPLAVHFDNQSMALMYIWDFGNGQTDTTYDWSSDADMIYTEPGTYTVTVISVLHACSDTLTFIIEVQKPDSDILLPNIITANGDGINDVFRINGVQIVSLELKIFNRWGQEIGLITEPDGVWTGEAHAEGTYYYILKATGLDKEIYDRRGSFQLVK